MKIGFTGTRNSDLPTIQKQAFIKILELWNYIDEFHHGDCTGADAFAVYEVWKRDIKIVTHPPDNPSERNFWPEEHSLRVEPQKPYLERNHDIVDATDLLIAMPKGFGEEKRSGTWATMRYAKRLGKPIVIIWPNGFCEAN